MLEEAKLLFFESFDETGKRVDVLKTFVAVQCDDWLTGSCDDVPDLSQPCEISIGVAGNFDLQISQSVSRYVLFKRLGFSVVEAFGLAAVVYYL